MISALVQSSDVETSWSIVVPALPSLRWRRMNLACRIRVCPYFVSTLLSQSRAPGLTRRPAPGGRSRRSRRTASLRSSSTSCIAGPLSTHAIRAWAPAAAARSILGWRLPRLRLPRRPPPRRRRGCGHRGRHRSVTATVGVRHWQLEGSGLFRAEHGPVGA
jgi:hypothetical protein